MVIFEEKLEEIEEVGDFKTLNPGGHVVVIKSAGDYVSANGTSTKVTVDIAEGEAKNFYQEQFDNNNSADKKWNNNATKYFSQKKENAKFLKGFGTSVNESNPNTNVFVKKDGKDALDETKTIGKKVGAMFGLKEYKNDKGEIKTTVELRNFRSIKGLKDAKMPKVAVINGTNDMGYDTYKYVDYAEYKKGGAKENNSDDVVVFDDLPF